MSTESLFVLIHSPLTWSRVAQERQSRGLKVLVPALDDSPGSDRPFWKQHGESISRWLATLESGIPVSLVAHSREMKLNTDPADAVGNMCVIDAIYVKAGLKKRGA